MCKRLVEGWLSKDAGAISDDVRTWSLEQWEALGLRPEGLIASHQEGCEKNLEQAPERMLQGVINPLNSALTTGSDRAVAGELNMGPVLQAMDYLEKLLGLPDECRPMAAQRGLTLAGANCAQCHQPGGAGLGSWNANITNFACRSV